MRHGAHVMVACFPSACLNLPTWAPPVIVTSPDPPITKQQILIGQEITTQASDWLLVATHQSKDLMSGRERDTKLNVIIAAWMTGHQSDMVLTSHWSMRYERGLSLA